MAYEKKDGDIAIYAVKEKKNERGPDFTGTALIDGVEKDVALWWKSETMLAGVVKEKWKGSQSGDEPQRTDSKPVEDIVEDSIPF